MVLLQPSPLSPFTPFFLSYLWIDMKYELELFHQWWSISWPFSGGGCGTGRSSLWQCICSLKHEVSSFFFLLGEGRKDLDIQLKSWYISYVRFDSNDIWEFNWKFCKFCQLLSFLPSKENLKSRGYWCLLRVEIQLLFAGIHYICQDSFDFDLL